MTPKDWREQAGLSQAEVAEKLDCGQSFVSMVERGVKGISLSLARKYVELSNGKISYDYFQSP